MKYNLNQGYWNNRYKENGGERTVGHKDWTEDEYKKANEYFFEKMAGLISDSSYCMLYDSNLLDFGVGIGRCSTFLKEVFSPKRYVGYDIVDNDVNDIVFRLIRDNGNLYLEPNRYFIAWTYVVLQHIIDDALLDYYASQIYDSMIENGLWIVTESIGDSSNNYVKQRSLEAYMKLFLKVGFKVEVKMVDKLMSSVNHATFFLIK